MKKLATLALVVWSAAATAASAQAPDLHAAEQQVEKIRGLRFKAPVQSITISRSELPDRLRAQFEKSLPYAVSDWETILQALLLVDDRKTDIIPSLLDLYQAQVLAYYDPLTKSYIMVRELPEAAAAIAGSAEMVNTGVAVHELTHAIQDQYFDVGRRDWDLRDDSDAGLAYHAVLEGEASLVMLASMIERMGGSFDAAMSNEMLSSTLAAAASADAVLGNSGAPEYFTELLKFPYLEGLKFVMEAYRRGGWKALDRIHQNPPSTTREILHPAEYFDHKFTPDSFTSTPAAGVTRPISVEHLGEFHWRYLVGAQNANGWKNDRVTIAADPSCRPTVLVETTWDSAADARRFYDAYLNLLDQKGVGAFSRITGNSVRVAYGVDRPLMERFVK